MPGGQRTGFRVDRLFLIGMLWIRDKVGWGGKVRDAGGTRGVMNVRATDTP